MKPLSAESILNALRNMDAPNNFDSDHDPVMQAGLASTLKERLTSFQVTHEFAVGDLVQTKAGMASKKLKGGVGIVTKVYDQPISNTEDKAGTPYFREPLDLVIGILDQDGDFLEFHYDSRRFEPYTGKLAENI